MAAASADGAAEEVVHYEIKADDTPGITVYGVLAIGYN